MNQLIVRVTFTGAIVSLFLASYFIFNFDFTDQAGLLFYEVFRKMKIVRQLRPEYSKGTVGVVTVISGDPFKEKFKKQWKGILDYCAYQNYTCLIFSGGERNVFANSPYKKAVLKAKHWRKIMAIEEALRRHQYVLFLDIDNYIVTRKYRVEDLFRNSSAKIVFTGYPGFSSSHIFAMENSQVATKFLKIWWERGLSFGLDCHYDQGAFIYAMQELMIRYMFVEPKRSQIDEDLRSCTTFVSSSANELYKRACNKFQECLKSNYLSWIGPIHQNDEGWERKIFPETKSKLTERVNELPLTWANEPWRKIGWDSNVKLTQAEGKKSIFSNCSSLLFSVHPVKMMRQLQCNGTLVDSRLHEQMENVYPGTWILRRPK